MVERPLPYLFLLPSLPFSLLPCREADPQNLLEGLEDRRKLPRWEPVRSPDHKRISVYLELENNIWRQHLFYRLTKKKKQLYRQEGVPAFKKVVRGKTKPT